MTKKTTDLQPGDIIFQPHRCPARVIRVETEPLPCTVATIHTQPRRGSIDWFHSGIDAEHSMVPLDSTTF